MSHFSVLVVRRPDESLEALLQPFHEYECTGVDDQYVVDIDVTEEVLKNWGEPQSVVRLGDGSIVSKYDNRFWLSTGEKDDFNRPKTEFRLPEGAEEIKIPQSELSAIEGQSMADWAEEYGGWKERHGCWYKHTNPSAKWDWWCVGGRYSGKFAGANKVAPQDDPRNKELCFLCEGTGKRNDRLGWETRGRDPNYTCNGCDGTGWKTKFESKWVNEDNEIRVGDLDLGALKERTTKERAEWIADIEKKSGLSRPELETALRLERVANAEWLTLPEPRPRGEAHGKWLDEKGGDYSLVRRLNSACWFDKPNLKPDQSVEQWIAAAPPLTCFALLKDGKWYERGEMGWWACVANEKDQDAWEEEVEKLLSDLGPDMILTVVDCHI